VKLTTHLPAVLKVRMLEAVSPFLYTSSWRGVQLSTYFNFTINQLKTLLVLEGVIILRDDFLEVFLEFVT
jgi:hypothetical protein